jgi:hypothetical protein
MNYLLGVLGTLEIRILSEEHEELPFEVLNIRVSGGVKVEGSTMENDIFANDYFLITLLYNMILGASIW